MVHISQVRFRLALAIFSLSYFQIGCVAFVPFLEPDVVLGRDGRVLEAAKGCPVSGIGELPLAQTASIETELVFFMPAPDIAPKAVPEPAPELTPKPVVAKKAVAKKLSPRQRKAQRLQILVSQLRDQSDVVRTHAASDLGLLGPYAAPAVQQLAYALVNDSSKWVRRAAARSLGKIGESSAAKALRRALSDRNKWVAHSAQRALWKIRR